ncbi:hypothetical protein C8J55DRAFT_492412 [Lentinula edodes]|uniref:PH domain-containing protein n=1 Tax=Lentinula lateritia TaxID=40482 RepID=A0A9W8ZX45_9AGAR|nr:hypothetical protein C8J55DRAFT_492412 [Lentinula edodes]
MATGETHCFQEKEAKQEVKLLTIACRFVPYDQWLVTHVDSSWTINEVKSWIVAKCIASSSSRTNPTTNFNLPPIHPPAKPKTKPSRRPASPIVFAEFPHSNGGPIHNPTSKLDGISKEDKYKRRKRRSRGRPISPITFAPIGVVDPQDDSEDDAAKLKDEGEVIGMGYEEDDEWDSQEDESDIDELELELDTNPRVGRRANRNQYLGFYDQPSIGQQSVLPPSVASRILPSKTLVNPASLPRGSYTTYHPNFLSLIRFSTGQLLERHYTILDYEIQPYELLEVHRLGVVTKLPREITSKYIESYWEGWVKALRLVFREPHVVTEVRSLAREGSSRRKDASVEEISKVSHAETARRTMEVLAGGPVKVAPFSPADVALGLRPPPPSRMKKDKLSVGNDLDIHTSMWKSTKLSNSNNHDMSSLSRNATAPTLKSSLNHNISNNKHRSKGKGGKLEWRERWVFIKDGVLHLRKENSESSSTTTQILPLDLLTEIRNADQLGRTLPSSLPQYIVCAKFKTPITTTKHPASVSPEPSYARRASQSNNPSQTPDSYSTLKSPVILSNPSSLSRNGSMSHPRNGSNHSALTGNTNEGASRSTSSPSISRPKIMLQIKPLPPPPPTSRVILNKEPPSSMIVSDRDEGKGEMPLDLPSSRLLSASERRVLFHADVLSGRTSENPSEVHTEEEGAASDDETDAVDLVGGRKKPPVVSNHHISDRKHPHIIMESDADSDRSGSTLSSPVFAHTENDSPFSDGPARSYGYSTGHFGGTSEWRRKGNKINSSTTPKRGGIWYKEEDEGNTEVDTSYVVVSGADDNAEGPRSAKGLNTRQNLTSQNSGKKLDPESEWVVLDLGDDFAFKSFLRVIHRHAPHVVDSSFLSTLPPFQMPKSSNVPAAPAPTPTFPSSFPTPEQVVPPSFAQWSWNTQNQERRSSLDEVSSITLSAKELNQSSSSPFVPFEASMEAPSNPNSSCINDTPAGTQYPVSPITAPKDSRQFRLPPSPRLLATKSDAQNSSTRSSSLLNSTLDRRQSETKQLNILSSQHKNSLGTFGALPYPEWRLEVVTKAQRAGMGELTKAMDQFMWGDNPGLAHLTRELGLRIAPMELIRSPSIQSAVGDRIFDNEEGDSAEDDISMRRQRKRKDRKLTLEQENIAIGLKSPGGENLSSRTLIDSGQQIPLACTTNISASGSDIARPSLRPGYVDIDSSESGEESSDAEWVGWMADLHRQARLHREENARLDRLETESLASSTDTNDYWDYQQQDDHRRYQEERRALEPTGVVTSSSPYTIPTSPNTILTSPLVRQKEIGLQQYASSTSIPSETTINCVPGSTASVGTSAVSPTFQRPATPDNIVVVQGPSFLTSPSSNESLNRSHGRRLSFGLSPSDPPSSATSPSLSQAGHSVEMTLLEHRQLDSRPNKHTRQISGMVRDGPNLSHYASTGLIGTTSELLELEMQNSSLTSARRPSMPILGSTPSTTQLDRPPTPPLIPDFQHTGTTLGGLSAESSRYAASAKLARLIGSDRLYDHTVAVTIPRRSSITGSVSSVSLGRSSSKAPGLLRKKAKGRNILEKEAEHNEDRETLFVRQKEKSRKGKEKEREPDRKMQDYSGEEKSRRQRLSLSLPNSLTYAHVSTSKMLSPLPTSAVLPPRDIRRTKSGQRLREERNQIPAIKKEKKRGLVREKAERLLQNLESKLDFVDD